MTGQTLDDEFEQSFRMPKILLLVSGIKVTKTPWNKYLDHFVNYQIFFYNVIILYIVVYGEIYNVVDCVQTGKPFVQTSINLPPISNCFLGTIKAALVYSNKGILADILHKLKAVHINSCKEDVRLDWVQEGKKIISDSVKTLRLIMVMMTAISIIVQISFCLFPGIMMAYYFIKTGESPILYPFIIKYHFFNVNQTSWWPLVYIHEVLAGVIAVANLMGCDIIFFALCFYFDMYFRVLCLEFENTVASSITETKMNLAKAIKKHQLLIDMVNQTEQVFSKPIFCHIVTASSIMCLSAFIITITDDMSVIISYVTLLMMAISQISLICYFPDILMQSSGQISESVYKSLWYNSNEDAKKIMLLVMIRSQRECKLTACGFVDLNLTAFTRILSTSYSYFALLRTMYN